MGLLVDGKWHDVWYDTDKTQGRFERSKSQFRNWVTKDGSAGVTGRHGFKAEAGRYHLYVSYACPWAHRTLIFRALKGLSDIISVSVVDYYMGKDGWTFKGEHGATGDTLYGSEFLHQIYTRADPQYSGRVTVPVLWDKKLQTIVSNESAEIIRMFNTPFDEFGKSDVDFYPEALRTEINALNDFIYPNINNGVYRAGFATSQEAYEEAYKDVFAALDQLEIRLQNNRYLTGSALTEADWRLFTTLIRFDPVYVGHFKCNLRRIEDYPALSNYTRELYQFGTIAETVNMEHIKGHYYTSHKTINPTGVVPLGPEIDFNTPHDRARLSADRSY